MLVIQFRLNLAPLHTKDVLSHEERRHENLTQYVQEKETTTQRTPEAKASISRQEATPRHTRMVTHKKYF